MSDAKQGNSITSSAALIRSSVNPSCELVAAIAIEQEPELRAYEQITGAPYKGEYGIRISMQRRGAKFETNNHENDAMALRKRVAEAFGYPSAEDLLVRDLDKEEPVTPHNVHSGNLRRHRKTQAIVRDAYLKKKSNIPDLVIHPTLELPVLTTPSGKPLLRGSRYINPDFMVLDRSLGVYLIGDEKSFIVRDETVVEKSKLDQVRRQIATGTLAMRYEVRILDPNAPLVADGLLIFASPYGLSASNMVREPLDGEIEQIERAVPPLQRVAMILAQLRAQGSHQLGGMADVLRTDLRESCYGRCIMTDYCEKRPENQDSLLGRDVQRLLGGKSIAELQAMVACRGSLPKRDEALLATIENAVRVHGMDLPTFIQEVA